MAFRVPEIHRINNSKKAGKYGIHRRLISKLEWGNSGMFVVPREVHRQTVYLRCMVSDGVGWDHVSVSLNVDKPKRCPSWNEMCFIKELFWEVEDCVIQFHPPANEYVSMHHYVLHLWKSQEYEHKTPPMVLVGTPKSKYD